MGLGFQLVTKAHDPQKQRAFGALGSHNLRRAVTIRTRVRLSCTHARTLGSDVGDAYWKLSIGALRIRIGFWGYYTLGIRRNPIIV